MDEVPVANDKFYSEKEARDILKIASQLESGGNDFSELHLQQMAQELGISNNALVLAKEQYLAEQSAPAPRQATVQPVDDDLSELGITPEIRAAYDKQRRRDFFAHLSVYLVMGIFFFLVNLFTSPGSWWFYWPVLGWGIGVAMHAVNTFVTVLDKDDYEDELIKWHTKRVKRRRKLTS